VIEGLGLAAREFPCGRFIEVFTDSQYVQKGISEWMNRWIARGWKTASGKSVKNRDLWLQLKKFSEGLNVKFKWVKGHAGNIWNERCDELVERERAKFFEAEPKLYSS